MAADPRIRASDEDRDRVVSLLREHHAAGRLTAEEFNERLDRAYEAKTIGELDELMSDLPAMDLARAHTSRRSAARAAWPGGMAGSPRPGRPPGVAGSPSAWSAS
jgi:cobalamin biosynthesis protein CbiG